MTGPQVAEPAVRAVAGTTTLAARALRRLAEGIVRDAARVSIDDVSVDLADDRGALRLRVSVPVVVTESGATTIVDDGAALRGELIQRMGELAGREVGAVDIRYAGVRRTRKGRVL